MKGIDKEGLHLSSRERWFALLAGVVVTACGVGFVRWSFTIPVPPLQILSLFPGVTLTFLGIFTIVFAINPKP